MIWAWHVNRKYFRFESTFQHVILPRANDLWLLADDHKLIRSRLQWQWEEVVCTFSNRLSLAWLKRRVVSGLGLGTVCNLSHPDMSRIER